MTSNTTFTPYHCNLIFLHFCCCSKCDQDAIWRMIHICGFLSLNYSFNWSHNLNSHMFSANEVVNLLVWKSKFIQDIKAEGSWLQFVWNSLALCDSLVSFFRVKSNIICALTSTIIPIRIIHSQIKAMHS